MNKVSTQLVEQVKDTCHEFCAALTDEEVSRFVRYTRIREMGSQEVVADIGEISDRFYLVIGGSIKLLQVDGEKEFEVGRIEPGCLVGKCRFSIVNHAQCGYGRGVAGCVCWKLIVKCITGFGLKSHTLPPICWSL